MKIAGLPANPLLTIFGVSLFLILSTFNQQAHAQKAISIDKIIDYQQDKQLMIDSASSFNLPEHVIEAIHHEIPLNFKIQIELLEKSKLLGFDYHRVRNQIEFHTELHSAGVNRLYALYNSRNHKAQTFQRLEEALQTLATLQAFPIASLSELHPEQSYTLRMRIKLDYWKLPAPLLIDAIFTDNWLLDSQWYETTLQTPLSWQ